MQDSGAITDFTYTDNEITAANVTSLNFNIANFTYSNNYVKVSSSSIFRPGWYSEFFLNDSSLPVRITNHEPGDPRYNYNSSVDFFYKPGTMLLDSVNCYDSVPLMIRKHFTFAYRGKNITKMIRNLGPYSDTSYYTYDAIPNMYKNSDPLLYIYSNLWTLDLTDRYYDSINNGLAGYTSYNTLFFFPKVFSESTLSGFSYTVPGHLESGTLNNTLSDDNKVLKEWFWRYRKEYFYSSLN